MVHGKQLPHTQITKFPIYLYRTMPYVYLLQSWMDGLIEKLVDFDQWLFLQMNTRWTHPWLDAIFPLWRDATFWVPLYLFLIVLALVNFGKKGWTWILFAIVNVTLTDQTSSTLVKKWVARIRPCNEEALVGKMRLLLDHCSGGFSFTSSHATNHFGFAMFVFLTTRKVMLPWSKWLFVWAGTIAYGQVYVGVHYPLDILVGSLLGCAIGTLTATFYNTKIGEIQPLTTT